MDIARELFRSVVASVKQQLDNLLKLGVLDSCDADWAHRGQAYVLQSILTESTLRYLGLCKFNETIEPRGVKFEPECRCDCGGGRIDLILTESGEEYAFEFKRWFGNKERDEILDGDYKKLVAFMRRATCRRGYELIFTVNDNRDGPPEFQHDKHAYYEECFAKDLGKQYSLLEREVLEHEKLTVCIYLAAAKREA